MSDEEIESISESKIDTYWYAFLEESDTRSRVTVSHKTKSGLTRLISDLTNHELMFIIKGKAYPFRVQKKFTFTFGPVSKKKPIPEVSIEQKAS